MSHESVEIGIARQIGAYSDGMSVRVADPEVCRSG
jgi:hypothetical protein